jgi:hypothetical protein
MDSAARPNARWYVHLAIVGAAVLAALVAAPATAATSPQRPAAQLAGAAGPASTGPRTPLPAFILSKGRYSAFDAPGAVAQTGAAAINNLGKITGNYVDGNDAYHGFVRDRRGRFATIDRPGAMATQPTDINDRDQIVGHYSTTARQPQAPGANARGFLLDRGRFIRIAFPRATRTLANGLNNRMQVVGEYIDAAGNGHGYRWEKGRFTTIDLPGAAATAPLNINDRGQIIGAYIKDLTKRPLTVRGFQLDNGRVTTFDVPPGPLTFPLGNNNRGQIVGLGATGAVTEDGPPPAARGFLLARGSTGPLTPIAFPAAPNTLPNGINDLGQIVGSYQNSGVPLNRQTPRPGTPGIARLIR